MTLHPSLLKNRKDNKTTLRIEVDRLFMNDIV